MTEKFGAGFNLNEDSQSSTDNQIVLGRLSVPHWYEGTRKEKQSLREEIEMVLMELCHKHCKSVGFCVNPIEGWAFRHYFKCFLYVINMFYTGMSGENSIERLFLFINDGNLYKRASDITDNYFKNEARMSSNGSWSSGDDSKDLRLMPAKKKGKNDIHGKQKITCIWTYPSNKVLVLLKDTTCDADVVITPVSGEKSSEVHDFPDPVNKIIQISIVEGQLHEAQTEALVSSIGPNLDLTNGAISASLLKKAGVGLQKDIRRMWRSYVPHGTVLKTGACQMPSPCKAIYLGVLKTYDSEDDSVSIFRRIMFECLQQASKSKYKSIAFPAIGTGRLGYPVDMVANLMLTAVMEFEKSMPKMSLKEVKFVIHPNSTEAYHAFQDQLQHLQSGHKGEVNKRNNHPVSMAQSMESVRHSPPLVQQNSSIEQEDTPKTSWQSAKGSEGSFAEKTIPHAQTDKKCCINLSGNIKDRKDLENRFSHLNCHFKPDHIVCPYGEESALLIFEKNIDVKKLQSHLKPLKVEQFQPEEVKFLVPDGLVERAQNAGQKEMLFINLQEVAGVEVTTQDKTMFIIGVTTRQIDIAKHYLEEFEKSLNITMKKQSNTMSSDSLDEDWDNQINTINNVSEVEFMALEILEHGFERIKNVQLSWHGNAILIDGSATDTTSVITYLSSQLKVLRNKQSVEIALDDEEKKIVKDVMRDVPSEDTVCVYDEKKSLVVLYSDKQDNIMKFKHKLKLLTGKLKGSVRSRKRFVENTQLLETSGENFSSSFRSTEIGQDFLQSKGALDKAEYHTNENVKIKTSQGSFHSSELRQDFSWFKGALDVEEFYTKENIKVAVYKADILSLSVDCIVNAANDKMQHGGGVARVIADAAGPELVQEGNVIIRQQGRIPVGHQVTTTAGRLPYKCVIHTVGPCWLDYEPHNLRKVQECEEDLYTAIYGCFTEAERNGLSTVALPAVSSGIYAVPQEMCAVQYAKAVLDYSRKSGQGRALKEIHFIDRLPNLVKLMQDTFRTMIQSGKVPNYNIQNYVTCTTSSQRQHSEETGRKGRGKQVVAINNCQYENTEPKELSPVYYEQGENHKRQFVFQISVKPVVRIYEGDILKLKHIDAIVCPDDSEGSGMGKIASELQKKTKYRQNKDMCFKRQKPNLGDVVITREEENPSNVIVHVVIENNSPQRQEFKSTIQKSIDNILRKTNQCMKVKTIALPLFGVKRELLTQKLWAESFLDRFVAFCCEVKNPNLEEVHIIIPHFSSSSNYSTVTKVFIEFADKFNKAPSDQKGTPPRPLSPKIHRTYDDTDDPMSGQGHESKIDTGDTDDNCTVCLCPKVDPKSLSCGHSFCSECYTQMLKTKPVCAVCGKIVGTVTGYQPNDGRMYVRTTSMNLAGYEGHGCIEITYDFPAGRQGPDHPSPGKWYSQMKRTAYLPNTPEGRNVCRMLSLAFDRRLVFTISQSRTTGKEGLTWNDIHHKTNSNPGAQFGYPDPEYLTRVKDELAAKGITESDLPPE